MAAGAVQSASQRLIEHVVDQRTLAAPAGAGDGRERAERNSHVDIPQDCYAARRSLPAIGHRVAASRRSQARPLPVRCRLLRLRRWLSCCRRGDAAACADCWEWESPSCRSRTGPSRKRGAWPTEQVFPERRLLRRVSRRRGQNRRRNRFPRITSRSCSTTISVLPRSRSLCNAANSRVLSRGCRPIVGSSSTYSTPHKPLPS